MRIYEKKLLSLGMLDRSAPELSSNVREDDLSEEVESETKQ